MNARRQTKQVMVGSLPIGGNAPISVQSMTNTGTRDVPATLAQIRRLELAGCELIRVAVPDEQAARTTALRMNRAKYIVLPDVLINSLPPLLTIGR